VGKWKGSGRDVNASLDEIGSPSRVFFVYIGDVDVAKRRPKGCFGSQEPQAHNWRNRSFVMHRFIL
jgi:hypothetical protein